MTLVRIDERLARFVPDRPDGDCWIWRGQVDTSGYGKFPVRQRVHIAHRFMYERIVGPIPDGLDLDHLCLVKLCVNPAHLEPVTRKENTRRWAATITHCRHGHPYTPENTVIRKNGTRICRECRNVSSRRCYARKRAAA